MIFWSSAISAELICILYKFRRINVTLNFTKFCSIWFRSGAVFCRLNKFEFCYNLYEMTSPKSYVTENQIMQHSISKHASVSSSLNQKKLTACTGTKRRAKYEDAQNTRTRKREFVRKIGRATRIIFTMLKTKNVQAYKKSSNQEDFAYHSYHCAVVTLWF